MVRALPGVDWLVRGKLRRPFTGRNGLSATREDLFFTSLIYHGALASRECNA
jgi:hypothetical protein